MRRLTTLLIVFALAWGLAAAATVDTTEVKIAREVDGPYILPASATGTFTQSVIRGVGNNFFLRATLINGTFDAGSLAPATMLTYAGTNTGSVTITPLGDIADGDFDADQTFCEWHVVVVTAASSYPTFNLNFSGVRINADGLPDGGTVSVQIDTRDANTNEAFDLPAASDTIAKGVWAIKPALVTSSKTVDVGADRKKFVGADAFLKVNDNGATIDVEYESSVYDDLGIVVDANWATSNEKVDVTFSSNLTSITQITIGVSPSAIVHVLTATEKAASSLTIEVPLNQLDDIPGVIFTVDGVNPIDTRILNVAMNVKAVGKVDNAHVFQSASKITQWFINGTVLGVPWINGNVGAMNGRVYLYNLSSITGTIAVKVKTLPRVGTASAELGTVVVGTLPGNGTAMIKLHEDVLAAIGGLTTPYVTDGGNLALEITIYTPNAAGLFQTFNNVFAYGTTPCIVIATGSIM